MFSDDDKKKNKDGSPKKRKKIKKNRDVKISLSSIPTDTNAQISDIVNQMGVLVLEDDDAFYSSHLIVGEKKRTLKVVSAIASGAWLVSQNWIFDSLVAGKWIFPEDKYELVDWFPGCKKSRLDSTRLLKGVKIALCGKTRAPLKELAHIVKNAGASIVDLEECDICISENGRYLPAADLSKLNLSVSWLIDSVAAHEKLDNASYIAASKKKDDDEEVEVVEEEEEEEEEVGEGEEIAEGNEEEKEGKAEKKKAPAKKEKPVPAKKEKREVKEPEKKKETPKKKEKPTAPAKKKPEKINKDEEKEVEKEVVMEEAENKEEEEKMKEEEPVVEENEDKIEEEVDPIEEIGEKGEEDPII